MRTWSYAPINCEECGLLTPRTSGGQRFCGKCARARGLRIERERATRIRNSSIGKRLLAEMRMSLSYKESRRTYQMLHDYGLSRTEYTARYNAQRGLCAICDVQLLPSSAYIDHNRASDKVRGLLCTKCNFAIGHFEDDPWIVERASDYLSRPPLWPIAIRWPWRGVVHKKSSPAYRRLKHYVERFDLGDCFICGKIKVELFIDHDHATSVVRGMLCFHCNTAIGLLMDDPAIATRAAEYLREHACA